MSSSLAVWANVSSNEYGASIPQTAKLGRSRINLGSKEIVEKSPVMIEIIGDVLRAACKALYV
jgi:hypothetical protein